MNREEAIRILNKLERDYPVDKWIVDDICVWPLIKIDLFLKWFEKQNPGKNWLPTRKPGTVSRILCLVSSFIRLIALLLHRKRTVSVLFSGANTHRVDFEGVFINRYFQPMIEYLNENSGQEALMIDYLPRDETKNYKPQRHLYFLDKYRLAVRMLLKTSNSRLQFQLPEFERFLKDVNSLLQLVYSEDEYKRSLRHTVGEIKVNAFIYDIFLRKFNPGCVIGLCYYNISMYGLSYAAYKHEIPSIDMQHGGQGTLHPAYNSFKKVPPDGYNIMPEIFWCWDKHSASDMQGWIRDQNYHQVVTGGNPWINYAISKTGNYNFPDQKIILYTLQFSHLDEYILRAIENTPSGYQWWLRAHPRKVEEAVSIRKQLQENGIDHLVNMEDATKWPLPVILYNCHVHISKFSGSVIEAVQLEIPCIIIDETGVQNYKELLNEGKAISYLEQDEHRLLDLITSITPVHKDNRQSANSNFGNLLKELQRSKI